MKTSYVNSYECSIGIEGVLELFLDRSSFVIGMSSTRMILQNVSGWPVEGLVFLHCL